MLKKKQSGFTIIELGFVIAIIALLATQILPRLEGMGSKSKIQGETQTNQLILSEIQKLYPEGVYDGLTNQVAIDGGAIPQTMVRAPGVIVNSWQGDVEIDTTELTLADATNVAGTTSDAVRIAYAGIPGSACASFVKSLSGAYDEVEVASDGDVNDATVGTFTNVKGEADDVAVTATVTAACDPGTNTNTVRFYAL